MSGVSSSPISRIVSSAAVIFGSVGIFLLSQFIGIFLLALALSFAGWDTIRITDWLTDSTAGQFITIIVLEAITVAGVWLIFKLAGKNWDLIKLKKTITKADFQSIPIGYALYFALSFSARLLISLLLPVVDLDQSQQIGFEEASGLPLILVFWALCLAVPIGEEVLFRGLLFNGLKKYAGLMTGAVITSLIFGAAHLELFGTGFPNWAAAADTVIFSGVLIWVYEKSGNLLVPIGLHMLKNSIAFMFLFIL